MVQTVRAVGWGVTFLVLIVFAIPWFLWGSATVVAGLPIWLWWHIGWMGLSALVFYAFTRSAWDELMGVPPGEKIADTRSRERSDARPDGGTVFGTETDAEEDDR